MPVADKQELVLAQNQYAFIQDETKGLVKVHVGPLTVTPSGNDRPVRYDAASQKFITCELSQAIQQNPTAPEGYYIRLENPAKVDEAKPSLGQSSAPPELNTGRKVNIQGPITFALWPGQVATVIEGHQLKSNEYVRARVYNVDEAKANWPKKNSLPSLPANIVTGQVIIIKGTEVNFFIPPTGIEVLPDMILKNQFVSQAVTLERLEYCLLLDQNGNKRYERGPQVVFPTATETFVSKQADSALPATEGEGLPGKTVKLKAIELNDQMGLYIKVIADYVDTEHPVRKSAAGKNTEEKLAANEVVVEGQICRTYKAGEELFITGKDQRIYYPRSEHAIIEYGSEDGKFKRQRYYGIAIPKGEARYVLNKDSGEVRTERGPKVFLPDPRHEVIVRRVLDSRTVPLWYPGNQEAIDYNQSLATLTAGSQNYVQDLSYNAAMDLARTVNRNTKGTVALAGGGASAGTFAGSAMQRGTSFTPPPSLTLNTKYDGPPTISPWTGYAVQVVDKDGTRKVVKGPTTVLLEYDQTLEKLSLSTGNPKTTDRLWSDVYLRVDHNKVSDTIAVETRDMVTANIKVSYRVNFEGDPNKWFSVENYVKFMTDHCRSLIRAKAKHLSIKELIDDSSSIVRDTILGVADEKTKVRPGKAFSENGMRIYDVEILQTIIADQTVAGMIMRSQNEAVKQTLELTQKEQEVKNAKIFNTLSQNVDALNHETRVKKMKLDREAGAVQHKALLEAEAENTIRKTKELSGRLEAEKLVTQAEVEIQSRIRSANELEIVRMQQETAEFVKRIQAVDPKVTAALEHLANNGLLGQVMQAVAPLAIMEQQGVEHIIARLFKGTSLEGKINDMLTVQEKQLEK